MLVSVVDNTWRWEKSDHTDARFHLIPPFILSNLYSRRTDKTNHDAILFATYFCLLCFIFYTSRWPEKLACLLKRDIWNLHPNIQNEKCERRIFRLQRDCTVRFLFSNCFSLLVYRKKRVHGAESFAFVEFLPSASARPFFFPTSRLFLAPCLSVAQKSSQFYNGSWLNTKSVGCRSSRPTCIVF